MAVTQYHLNHMTSRIESESRLSSRVALPRRQLVGHFLLRWDRSLSHLVFSFLVPCSSSYLLIASSRHSLTDHSRSLPPVHSLFLDGNVQKNADPPYFSLFKKPLLSPQPAEAPTPHPAPSLSTLVRILCCSSLIHKSDHHKKWPPLLCFP